MLTLYRNNSVTRGFGWFDGSWRMLTHADLIATAGDGLIHSVAGTVDGTNSRYLYLDGIQKATDTPATSAPTTNNKELTIGSYVAGATRFEGNIYCTYIWDRQISHSEVSSIDSDPYQILTP